MADSVFRQNNIEHVSAPEQLSERERSIIVWRFYHGLSARETAEKADVSYANVRFLQHRALKKLRDILEAAGLFENF